MARRVEKVTALPNGQTVWRGCQLAPPLALSAGGDIAPRRLGLRRLVCAFPAKLAEPRHLVRLFFARPRHSSTGRRDRRFILLSCAIGCLIGPRRRGNGRRLADAHAFKGGQCFQPVPAYQPPAPSQPDEQVNGGQAGNCPAARSRAPPLCPQHRHDEERDKHIEGEGEGADLAEAGEAEVAGPGERAEPADAVADADEERAEQARMHQLACDPCSSSSKMT